MHVKNLNNFKFFQSCLRNKTKPKVWLYCAYIFSPFIFRLWELNNIHENTLFTGKLCTDSLVLWALFKMPLHFCRVTASGTQFLHPFSFQIGYGHISSGVTVFKCERRRETACHWSEQSDAQAFQVIPSRSQNGSGFTPCSERVLFLLLCPENFSFSEPFRPGLFLRLFLEKMWTWFKK